MKTRLQQLLKSRPGIYRNSVYMGMVRIISAICGYTLIILSACAFISGYAGDFIIASVSGKESVKYPEGLKTFAMLSFLVSGVLLLYISSLSGHILRRNQFIRKVELEVQ